MGWVRIDDGFYEHAKWIDAPGDSIALWLAAIAWCNRNTADDGFIPARKITALVKVRGLRRTIRDLLERGGFEERESNHTEPGYFVHDYADWQRPDRVAEIRAARAEAGRRGAEKRWQTPSANGIANEWQNGRQIDSPAPAAAPAPAHLLPASTAAAAANTVPAAAAAAAALDLLIAHKLVVDTPRSQSGYRRKLQTVLPIEHRDALDLYTNEHPNATRDDIARDVFGMSKTEIRRASTSP